MSEISNTVEIKKEYDPLEYGRKVKIRPVPIKKNTLIVGNDAARVKSESIWLTGSTKSILTKLDPNTNRLVNVFKSTEQRMWFEKKLGVKLDPNVLADNHICNVYIKLTKSNEDIDDCFLELDLGIPEDYLKYLVCLASEEVSNQRNAQGMYNADQIFFIDDDEVSAQTKTKDNSIKDTCLKYLYKYETDAVRLKNFVRVYDTLYKGSTVKTRGLNLEGLYNHIRDLIEDRTTRPHVYKLVSKISENNSWYMTMTFTLNAIEIGEVKYYPDLMEFKLTSGEVIGKSYDEVLVFFQDSKNQAIKVRIQDQIKNQLI